MSQMIKETTLRELIAANSVRSISLIGQRGGYAISIRCGKTEHTLASTRGDVRLFSLEHATKFLSGLGIAKFEVDATGYEPGRLRKPRPDRAEALRRTRTKLKQGVLL